VATIIAVGVASPKAQGQAIISTEMAFESAKERSFPKTNHNKNVINEMTNTIGSGYS
jgi:hypothetical protein